jgi:mannitol/fructose-specific phosphotransferase system IIA component (Ntr-type)
VPLVDHLQASCVLLDPKVSNKWELLDQMVDHLVDSGALGKDQSVAAKTALVDRERSVSTGMEHGIAVPHAALDQLECLKVAMALVPTGLEFQSVDGRPAQIIMLLLVPKSEKLLHLSILTEIARRLGVATFREQLLACTSTESATEIWC